MFECAIKTRSNLIRFAIRREGTRTYRLHTLSIGITCRLFALKAERRAYRERPNLAIHSSDQVDDRLTSGNREQPHT